MKHVLKILAVVCLIAVAFVFVLPPMQRFSGLSERVTHWVAGAIGVALAWLALYGVPSLSWLQGVPKVQLFYRVSGAAVAIVGGILAFGNRSGLLITFPFAGTIVVVVGVCIYCVFGKVR